LLIYPNGKKVLQEYDHTDRLIKNTTLENGKKKREKSPSLTMSPYGFMGGY